MWPICKLCKKNYFFSKFFTSLGTFKKMEIDKISEFPGSQIALFGGRKKISKKISCYCLLRQANACDISFAIPIELECIRRH